VKRCPYCAEEIQDAAIVCKHCGRDLRPGQDAPATARFEGITQRPSGFSPVTPSKTNQSLGAILGLVGAGVFVLGSLFPNYVVYQDDGTSLIGFGDYDGKAVIGNILSYWSLAGVTILGAAFSLSRSKLRRLGGGMALAGGLCLLLNSIPAAFLYFAGTDKKVGVWLELAGSVLSVAGGVLLIPSVLSSD
jgi:zinc ribbon protein